MTDIEKSVFDECSEAAKDAHWKIRKLELEMGTAGIWAMNQKQKFDFYRGVRECAVGIVMEVLGTSAGIRALDEMYNYAHEMERKYKAPNAKQNYPETNQPDKVTDRHLKFADERVNKVIDERLQYPPTAALPRCSTEGY